MPDYFAGYEIVTQTKNFLVTCDGDPDARQRASLIGATCENDLARLNDLFSTHFEAGNTSPHSVWVIVLKDDPTSNANGWNYGYETEESSRIVVQRAFVPPPPAPPSIFPPDPAPLSGPDLNAAVREFPRFVFVAELAEIMMSFTGYGWDAGHSPGEGLSNLLGALLHPAGYYDAGQGPRINSWLNGTAGPPSVAARADYIFNTVNTDKDILSYGCAILFINYLVYQLGYSLKSVIRAGGSTLAETYATVTGQPTSAAYGALNGLLQQHIGNSTTNTLGRDNIFPLQDIPFRSLDISENAPIDKGAFTDPLPVSWTVKPGQICSAGSFSFYLHHSMVEQAIYIRAHGMANANFTWNVNGLESVGAPGNTWTDFTVATPLNIGNPGGTTTTVAGSVDLQFASASSWNLFVIYLRTSNSNGNCNVTVNVTATEAAFTSETPTAASDTVSLNTVVWIPGQAFKDAVRKCNPFYENVNSDFWDVAAKIVDLRHQPNPPPPESEVLSIVDAVEQLQRSVALFAAAGPFGEGEVWSQLSVPELLRSAISATPEVSASRLRPSPQSQPPQIENDPGNVST